MLLERELNPESLVEQIKGLFAAPELLQEIGENARSVARLDAAKVIVDEMLSAFVEKVG